jgi:hypothetical protein
MAGVSLCVLIAAWTPAKAQTSKQLWADYNPSWWMANKAELFGDVGLRSEIEDQGWWRLVVRPGVQAPYRFVWLTAGVGNFITFNELIDNRWEIRPFQGISAVWPNRKISLDHYLRFEQRFDFNTDTWTSLNSLRLRYRLRATYRWAAQVEERYWTATASGEGFVTLAGEQGQLQEQFRVTAGIERNFSRKRRIRFEITWQQEGWYFDPSRNIDDIFFRVRWYRRW